jgi:uncharacterized membrane protein YphA (DoxX/SURF4 family)
MSQITTFQGRSFLFNALFVILNIVASVFVVMGFHENFEEQGVLFKTIGFLLLAISITGIFIFKGKLMMASVSRVLVGGLCIVSGLVKANDPLGFAYKLEEYFEDGALAYRIKEWFGAPGFSIEFLAEYALTFSVIICVVEIVLGVLILIGGKMKLVSWLTLLMMLFFTFLTGHTANCDPHKKFVDRDTYEATAPQYQIKIEQAKTNKEIKIIQQTPDKLVVEEMKSPQCVSDCGCFGDALKGSVGRSLTPFESLWKDIVLVYLTLWIFICQWKIQPNTGKQNAIYFFAGLAVISFFSWVFGWSFPVLFGILVLLGSLWILPAGGRFLGNHWGSMLMASIISMIFITYVLMYDPLKDYRPYAEGNNIEEKMNDGIAGVTETLLVYKNIKNGKLKKYLSTSKEYIESKIWEKTADWKFLEQENKVIIPSRLPSISDFNPFLNLADVTKDELKLVCIQDQLNNSKVSGLRMFDLNYNAPFDIPMEEYDVNAFPAEEYEIRDTIELQDPNVTEVTLLDYIIHADEVYIAIIKDLDQTNVDGINKLKQLYQEIQKDGIPMFIVCSSSPDEINKFKAKYGLSIPMFLNDEKVVKTITRSNPALLIVRKGTIVGKYPHRSIPSYKWIKKYLHK